jgi:hypothetical protein
MCREEQREIASFASALCNALPASLGNRSHTHCMQSLSASPHRAPVLRGIVAAVD